ncbi:hypothetical protein P3S68_002656 [Capsicum galapagoense]
MKGVTSGSNRYFDHSVDSFLPVRACCHAGKSRDVGRLYLLLNFSDQFFAAITLIHLNSVIRFSLSKEVVISKSYNHLLACLRYMKHDLQQIEHTTLMEPKAMSQTVIISLYLLVLPDSQLLDMFSKMEIGLAVGGAVGGAFLNVFFDRLAPRVELLKMFQKHKHDDGLLEKLEDILLGLQIVLSDAENKQASNPLVRKWLNKLQRAMDGAESLLEEVNYEALRLKVEGQLRNLAETSNQQVSDLNLSLSDDYFLYIEEKLEDTIKTLEVLESKSVALAYRGILIRTTLAKTAYNDEKVKSYFNLKAWFCVSEPYDAIGIKKGLLQEIGSFDLKDDNNINQLRVKLKESLKGKRFLIVLDDMWNDDYNEWNDLRTPFVQGDMGSKITVTTRRKDVAGMMGSGSVNVGTLSSEASWALFKRHSLKNRDPKEHPELEEVGKQIADKCKGLPLPLKTLAGFLSSKSEVDEWTNALRSEIWELPRRPNAMFCKEQVIHLWIANGLVQPLHSGNQYFNELRSRSLFERVPESSERDGGKFLMHDLVNDLAQIASSKLCVRLEECQGSHMLEQSRHLSYSMGRGGEFKKLNPLSKSEQLRTLLPISIQYLYRPKLSKRVLHNILPRLTSLRALSLSGYEIVELPDALFIKLKLLRFLDLSRTKITKLPNSICDLYNLETLLLSSCDDLEELSLQMEKLINLRHLDISNTSLLKMPLHLSKLKSLQVLVGAKFLLGGWRMKDLGGAHYLYGSLSILELQNVVDRREALKAKMRDKNHVEKYRGTQFPNWLADHSFLKLLVQLSLSNCKDCFSLPALGQLPSLKFLSIREMHRMTEVTEEFYGSPPSKKPFNSVEKLEFAEMPEWKQWHALGKGEFPALQNLSIEDCPKLTGKLPENLCSLSELRFSRCPELNLETPIQLSSLKWFEVEVSPKVGVVFDEAELFTSQHEGMKQIEKLYISDCNSLITLPTSTLRNTLKKILIAHCRKFKLEVPVCCCYMFLDILTLDECDSIDDLSSFELVPRARTLLIMSCQNLTRFLIPNGTEALDISCCENLEILSVACGTQMTSLNIFNCRKLKRLPERMQELLPSLEELTLSDCPEMESFPDGGLPFNLQLLTIDNCEKLVNCRKEWRLQRLPCLRELWIEHDGSDEEIVGGENGSCHALFKELPQIQSLLEQGLPSYISQLRLHSHIELRSLQTEGLGHLTSLQCLEISNCHQLQSLPETAVPSSLSELTIRDCPNLQSLPVKGMPSSLSKLYICFCPLLNPLLEFDKGEYWSKIAHIPEIYIDNEVM